MVNCTTGTCLSDYISLLVLLAVGPHAIGPLMFDPWTTGLQIITPQTIGSQIIDSQSGLLVLR